jgi:hypothetical protein
MEMARHSPQQVVALIRRIERRRRAGAHLGVVLSELGISRSTYGRWRRRFPETAPASWPGSTAQLRELRRENARLRRIVADSALEIEALRELSRGTY